ncbi:hypothetical protein M8818_003239 [Zalaria obscura]|uniref:Uncharacterized protein n=1 Tax=Zalaria obscura TaxID=2024903 RepID=A0ACC3SFE4_9PEZI
MFGAYQRLQPMMAILPCFKGRSATDARDIVYSARGLAADGERYPSPDYNKSTKDVFIEYAVTTIELRYYTLTPLLAQAGVCLQNPVSCLPSWVPDWSFDCTGHYKYDAHRDNDMPYDIPEAEDSRLRTTSVCRRHFHPVTVYNDGDDLVLHVQGTALDGIKAIGQPVLDILISASKLALAKSRASGRANISTNISREMVAAYYMHLIDYLDENEHGTSLESSAEPDLMSTTLTSDAPSHLIETDSIRQNVWKIAAIFDIGSVSSHVGTTARPHLESILHNSNDDLMRNRTFCRTAQGTPAIVPDCTKAGDVVVALDGVAFPVVLRKRPEGGHIMIGELATTGEGPAYITPDPADMVDFYIY